jgi:hypothetical protein
MTDDQPTAPAGPPAETSIGVPAGVPAVPPSQAGGVVAGFFLAIGLHVAVLGGIALMGIGSDILLSAAGVGLLCIGATEWIYLIPAVIYARKRGRKALAKGILISGGVTALLNGACWGFFALNPPSFR